MDRDRRPIEGITVKAAILEKQGEPIEICDDVDIIDPRPGEVKVRVEYCSLCHSDASVSDGVMLPLSDPIILGHEAAGIVESLGPGVRDLEPGDSVVLAPAPPCGTCYYCQRHDHSLCVNGHGIQTNALPDGTTGLSRGGRKVLRGLGVGGLCEYVITPASGAVKVPADTPLDVACIIGCAIQTGVGAVLNTARVEPGATLLVTGLGGVGIATVQGARIAGATTIVASDPVEERRNLARKLGATHVIDPTREDLPALCQDLTAGIGLDYAFETAGVAELISQCVELIRAGGSTVCVGSPPYQQDLTLKHVVVFAASGKKLLGCLNGSSNSPFDIPRFVRLWQASELHLEEMITRRRPLSEVNEALADLKSGTGVRTVMSIAD
jgi:Zn-dependent alcohol dehydrogenase